MVIGAEPFSTQTKDHPSMGEQTSMTTANLREETSAGKLNARICEGEAERGRCPTDPPHFTPSPLIEASSIGLVSCVDRLSFDSESFGFSCYRVSRWDTEPVSAAVRQLLDSPGPLAISAKVPADNVATASGLMLLGFRKVCMQATLSCDLSVRSLEPVPVGVTIRRGMPLDDETVWRHARNFRYDRFSLDPLMPAEGRHRLYFCWIRNSLAADGKLVAATGQDFCSFFETPTAAVIDLVSILEPRRGNGSKVVAAVLAHAKAAGLTEVRVTTECENTPALRLYHRLGFTVATYTAALHLVRQ